MEQASILIVEDEAVVALDLKVELEALGYRIAGIADTAERAIELVRRWRPALTLMDIRLKGETDGVHAAQALRDEFGAPVVFLTSFSDPDTVRRAAATGAYGYLTKPFQARELRACIEVALSKAQMERRLRESERWFASTLRCVQDGVVLVDPGGRIRYMNSAAEALLGWSTDEAAGQPVDAVVRFADAVSTPCLALQVLAEGRVLGVRHARMLCQRGGAQVPVDESAGPIQDERERPMGAVLVLRDAALRLRQEARLRASEERFRGAFELAPLGMALIGLDGRFIQVNATLCRLLAASEMSLLRVSQAELTHPQDIAHERARLAELEAGRERVVQFEKRYLRGPQREPVWALVSASLLRDDNEPTCHLYQVHDLTAQKAAAAQLAELAGERIRREASELADRRRNEFLSRVSHEMRTPLNAVLGFAELMNLQQARGAPLNAAYPKHIADAGKHLLALVDDLLALQRVDAADLHVQMGPVALDEVLAAALQLLMPMAQDRGVTLRPSLASGLRVLADATRLRQVVLNLGSNAVKYNHAGGTVAFEAHTAGPGRVVLQVRDDGIGMSADQIEHLFEPFNRLGREASVVTGVGLGLVITRKLVEHMGGSLAVRSQPAVGTTVDLELRAAAP